MDTRRATPATDEARCRDSRETRARPHAIGEIAIRVREPNQLFNSMDPSPFHERELDRSAEEYIVDSARELPPDAPVVLAVHVETPTAHEDEPVVLRDALRRHFARRSTASRRELRELLRNGRTSLAIGLVFLGASLVGSELLGQALGVRPLADVARESLIIGGWVAMWRPLEIFLYEWWPLLAQRRLYDRLRDAVVCVVHAGAGGEASAPSSSAPRHRFTG